MKEIRIEIPEGKEVKWVDGVLTFVDEDPKDITERIKTFEDALEELGEDNQLVKEYRQICKTTAKGGTVVISKHLIAYIKVCIIAAALNEGWEPKFEKGEYRYFPWFYLYTKEQYDELDDEKKGCCVLRSGGSTNASYGFVYSSASYDATYSSSYNGSRLAFRTRELADYAGRQFTEEWADFMFELNSRIFIKQ